MALCFPALACYIDMEFSKELFDFIRRHESDDVCSLRLKYSRTIPDREFLDFALMQIESRRKVRKKLPGFVANPLFLFPSSVAAEQASNEAVAHFHASLIDSGSSLLDMTAGLGIDAMSFAAAGAKVTACEFETIKCEVLKHNAELLGLSKNLNVQCCNSISYICSSNKNFDIIFADPARRAADGHRVHALAQCEPDIEANMTAIFNHTSRLLVKTSPLLDISLIVDSVENLHHIYIVCFRGECKEVLLDIRTNNSFTGATVVDIDWNHTISTFHSDLKRRDSEGIQYLENRKAEDFKFLYEPNAGVMKTGDWHTIQSEFSGLRKADTNTHIFLSDEYYPGFPGRILQITSAPDKKGLKSIKGAKINVVSRNHPLSAPLISKKYGLTPGADDFLYALRCNGTPTILLAKIISKEEN